MSYQSTNVRRPVVLVLLDGWGYAPRTEGNAISMAHTPYYDELCRKYPMTTLYPCPVGERAKHGNPEIGHLSLGTGRESQTEIDRVRNAIEDESFLENPVMVRALERAAANASAVHLVGLISDGGIHSSTESLFAMLRLAKRKGLKDVFIHCILDGVDVPQRTADVYVEALEIKLADIGVGRIASLCGRFLAMDNTEHWERTARVFTMLVHAEGERVSDAVGAVRNSFLRGIADEFIAPIIVESEPGVPVGTVKNGDLVAFFNHRGDTMRQLVRSLCVPEGEIDAKPSVDTVCLTEYDRAFNLPAAYLTEPKRNTLIETLSKAEIPSSKITEGARRVHLTHFFDGGADEAHEFDQETVVDLKEGLAVDVGPESMSFKITDEFRRSIASSPSGLFVLNLPAAALSAEVGDLGRTIASVQFIDTCLEGICEKTREMGGVVLLTATHGSCEEMIHMESGEPNPNTTANPVPFHYIDDTAAGIKLDEGRSLEDIAPTILGMFDVEKPKEMTGSDIRCI